MCYIIGIAIVIIVICCLWRGESSESMTAVGANHGVACQDKILVRTGEGYGDIGVLLPDVDVTPGIGSGKDAIASVVSATQRAAKHATTGIIGAGTEYAKSCTRGWYLPTTYQADEYYNTATDSSKNMNYTYSYWNGIKLASCDECPNPYACPNCPKFAGAGEGVFDNPNLIRGLNEEIDIGIPNGGLTDNHAEFYTSSPVDGAFNELLNNAAVSVDGVRSGSTYDQPRPQYSDISPLASNAYKIAQTVRLNKALEELRKRDAMVTMSDPRGEFVGTREHMGAGRAMKPRAASRLLRDDISIAIDGSKCIQDGIGTCGDGRAIRDLDSRDSATLLVQRQAKQTACKKSMQTTAAQLLYTGVLGLRNPDADLSQCEYLHNNYVYQEPCLLGEQYST